MDLTGQRFGRLTVLHRAGNDFGGRAQWSVECDCGTRKVVRGGSLKDGRTKSCGCYNIESRKARVGALNPRWKGGRNVNGHGYVEVRRNGKRKLEHRLVMEQRIGRPLLPTETVHHIDGNRQNNDPANLELWTTRHPTGVRASDIEVTDA